MKRLGIFGGTFNPIHVAHLRCAEEVRETLGLDHVLFVPASNPPHKQDRSIAPAADRLAMVRLAVRGNRAFRVSSIEIDRPGRSFSVDSLRILRAQWPSADLVFLIGLDAFREIGTWKDYRALFGLAGFAVFTRPPDHVTNIRGILPVAARREFCYGPDRETLVHTSGNRIQFLNLTALDISASAIRLRRQRGRSIRYLVPAAVEGYIHRRCLYLREDKPS